MVNRRAMKFVVSFLGILFLAMIILVVASYFDQRDVDEIPAEMNLANQGN